MSSLTGLDFDKILEMLPEPSEIIKAIVAPHKKTDMVPSGTMMKVQDVDGFYLVVNKQDLADVKRDIEHIGLVRKADMSFLGRDSWRGIPVIETDEKYREVVALTIENFRTSLVNELIKPVKFDE